jgi:hypothetical protein
MRKIRIFLCLSIFIMVFLFWAFIPQHPALVFQPNYTKEKLAYIQVKDERTFQIKYTHSIHLSDVVESYKITPSQKLQQYELMYEDFAIGMPSNAEEGESFQQINGIYYIKNMKRVFPFFHIRIGQVIANHRLIYNNKEFPLSRTFEPGTSIKVEIRKLNYFELWKGVNILESI